MTNPYQVSTPMVAELWAVRDDLWLALVFFGFHNLIVEIDSRFVI